MKTIYTIPKIVRSCSGIAPGYFCTQECQICKAELGTLEIVEHMAAHDVLPGSMHRVSIPVPDGNQFQFETRKGEPPPRHWDGWNTTEEG